jgi:hypothetical protein
MYLLLFWIFGLGALPAWAQDTQSTLAPIPPESSPQQTIDSEVKPPAPPNSLFPTAQHQATPLPGRVIGQVMNQMGTPIAQAEIQLGDTKSQTDSKGEFELIYSQPGQWALSVSHPDYDPLKTQIWIQPSLTTPVDIVLKTPIVSQPRTRLGILGVGSLTRTVFLSQHLAAESVRLGLIPAGETVLPLNNQRLEGVLQTITLPLYEIFEWDRRKPEAVKTFFELTGLKALIVTRTDILTRPASDTKITLKSRSRWELWELDAQDQLQVRVLAEASRESTEASDLNEVEVGQLYQVQVTDMAKEIYTRWQSSSPIASYFDPQTTPLSPHRSQLDTTVELRLNSVPSPTP